MLRLLLLRATARVATTAFLAVVATARVTTAICLVVVGRAAVAVAGGAAIATAWAETAACC
jgi:hypothetical protein